MRASHWFAQLTRVTISAIGLLSTSSISAYAFTADEWPMFGHDERHSGNSATTGLPALLPGAPTWTFPTGAAIYSSAAIVDQKIFFGSDDGKCYCLTITGALLWSYQTAGLVRSSPAVNYPTSNGGYVYFVSGDNSEYSGVGDHQLYCLDHNTGFLMWKFHLGATWPDVFALDPAPVGGWVDSSPTLYGDRVYVGARNGWVYCLDADVSDGVNDGIQELNWSPTGSDLIWKSKVTNNVDGYIVSTPAIAWNALYIGVGDFDPNPYGILWALRLSDGTKAGYCRFGSGGNPLDQRILSSPTLAESGAMRSAFLGSCNYNLYSITADIPLGFTLDNPIEMEIRWESPLNASQYGCEIRGTPAYNDGHLYCASGKGLFYLNAWSPGGTEYQVHPLPLWEEMWSSPAIGESMVYSSRTVWQLNNPRLICSPKDAPPGDALWMYVQSDDGANFFSSPALGYGRVVIGCKDAHLYCFE